MSQEIILPESKPFCTVETKNAELHEEGLMRAHITFYRSAKNVQEVEDFLNQVDVIYSRNRSFVLIYEASPEIKSESVANLTKIAGFMKLKQEHTRRLVKACAVILPNPALRKIIQAIFWFRKPACKLLVCESQATAEAFLNRSVTDQ